MSGHHRTRRPVGWWVCLVAAVVAPLAGAAVGLAFPSHAPTTCTPTTTVE